MYKVCLAREQMRKIQVEHRTDQLEEQLERSDSVGLFYEGLFYGTNMPVSITIHHIKIPLIISAPT